MPIDLYRRTPLRFHLQVQPCGMLLNSGMADCCQLEVSSLRRRLPPVEEVHRHIRKRSS